MVIYVFVSAANPQNSLSHDGEQGVGDKIGVAVISKALAESLYDSETMFCFPQQDHSSVRRYFVGIELTYYLSGSMGFGVVFGDSGTFEG